MTERPIRCSCCGQPLTAEPARICQECFKPLLRGHKWKVKDGRLVHRHCQWPNSYLTPDEYRKQFGHDMYQRVWGQR